MQAKCYFAQTDLDYRISGIPTKYPVLAFRYTLHGYNLSLWVRDIPPPSLNAAVATIETLMGI